MSDVRAASDRPTIWVIAGTNGAGKSSVRGATLRARGGEYFNPDEATQELLARQPSMGLTTANGAAWLIGKRMLERAVAERRSLTFETTLGGRTITSLLHDAILASVDVAIWYVALSSPELHLARVRARVAAGGHDIPEHKVRERYDESRKNLISLMQAPSPGLAELQLYDNSEEGDPKQGVPPRPRLLLHLVRGKVARHCDLATVPDWAKPMFAIALRPRP